MRVTALAGANQLWVEDMLVAAGLSADDVEFSAVGYGESAYTALETGRVDLLSNDGPPTQMSTEINCDNLDLALDAGTTHGVLAEAPRQTCDNTKGQR